MAEFLCAARDKEHLDKTRPHQNWLEGMVIHVAPNGFAWGSMETPPTFLLIRVPAISLQDVQHLLNPKTALVERQVLIPSELGLPTLATRATQTQVERRQYRINTLKLPAAAIAEMRDKPITLKPAELLAAIEAV